MLAAKPKEGELEQKSCTVMALLDGGMLTRHKSWLKVLHFSFVLHVCNDLGFLLLYYVTKKYCILVMCFIQCLNVVSGGAPYYCGGNDWEFVPNAWEADD